MNSHTRTDFLVCNRLGTVLHTFADRDLAIRWAKANERDRGALHVEEQTVTTTRRKVWSPRVRLVGSAS